MHSQQHVSQVFWLISLPRAYGVDAFGSVLPDSITVMFYSEVETIRTRVLLKSNARVVKKKKKGIRYRRVMGLTQRSQLVTEPSDAAIHTKANSATQRHVTRVNSQLTC